VVNLGYTEALWRQTSRQLPLQLHRFFPELISLYPTYRFHITSGHLHSQDLQLSRELARRLPQLIDSRRSAAIFCPLGFGGHVDHILVKRASRAAFNHQLIFWSDFPYVLNKNFQPSPQFTRQRTPCSFSVDFPAKLKLCRLYRTQFPRVIPDPQLLTSPETFYPPHTVKV
jgi:LmbE family N-acetylglucosaminyl deacetylase